MIGVIFLATAVAHTKFQSGNFKDDAKDEQLPPSTIVELGLTYDFNVPGETSRIDFVVVVPKTISAKQTILGTKYSPEPAHVFYENDNRYAAFVFVDPPRQFKLQIDIRVKLFEYDLYVARTKAQAIPLRERDFEEFLRHESGLEKDDVRIRKIAKSLTGQNEVDVVRRIFDYVTDSMEYTICGERDTGAIYALEHKKGDCSEYSDLFVALCRAKDIPARFVTGYTMRLDEVSPKHHWVEVYLRQYGWVPFDPSWGDVGGKMLKTVAFEKMQPLYIYLTHIRNDKLLQNAHYYSYVYWGDKPEVTDSIELRQVVAPAAKP